MSTRPTTLKDMQEKDRKDRADYLKQQMSVLEMPVKSLLVGAFERDFLPYFSGKLPFTDDVRTIWLSVAGTMLNPVRLVDSSGQMVAIVPALAANNVAQPMNPNRRKHADAESTMDRVTRVSSLNANAGLSALHSGLGSRFAPIAGRKDQTLEQQWMALFKYFGVEMPVAPGASPKTTGTPAAPATDFDFDDL